MTPPVRVLVVDDSAFARKVLRESLSASPAIEVVGTARDGLEALERIAELRPDVVTLDLMMPGLDGIGVLRELAASGTTTRVLVVSISDEESEVVVDALRLGAVGLVRKPTALATERLYELAGPLVQAVLDAALARPALERMPAVPIPPLEAVVTDIDLLVVGTSTGGPQALTRLVADLPAGLPLPVAIALHIPREYTEALAKRLDEGSALHVVEATEGLVLTPGLVVLARGGIHLRVDRERGRLVAHLTRQPAETLHFPSVDVLFESAATACGPRILGVVLTGMGNDGLSGSHAIVAAGGRVITEAESSCIVYGMPRSVAEAGLSSGQARIEHMGRELVSRITVRRAASAG